MKRKKQVHRTNPGIHKKMRRRNFADFFSEHAKILVSSFKDISMLNVVSMITDILILGFTSIVYVIYNLLFIKAMNDLNDIIMGVGVNPETSSLFLQFKTAFQFIGTLVVAYFLLVAGYSLFNSMYWLRANDKKITWKKILVFAKHNLIFTFSMLILVYGIRLILRDPFWAYIDMLLIILFLPILAIMHILSADSMEKRSFVIIKRSVALFFKRFCDFFFPGIVIFVVFIILSIVSKLFAHLPLWINNFVTFIAILFFMSWIRLYFINVMRSVKDE
ncbi:MAG: hypothetical protein ACLFPQ_04630 [Candidatus Woesearchaeota archaeon]